VPNFASLVWVGRGEKGMRERQNKTG